MRAGILEWNKAFEAAGFVDAVVAPDAPPGFDYQDIRFSSVHWAPSFDLSFGGYGPSRIDPRTGEILNADIVVIGDTVATNAWAGTYPTRGCASAAVAAHNLMLARALGGTFHAVDAEAVLPEILKFVAMHEVGHTLGLRHNFRGSAGVALDRLHDKAWTAVHGTMSSVMDYPTLSVAPPGTAQGFFMTPTIGDYDRLAIRYGYQPGADDAALAALASEATKPGLQFSSDEELWVEDWAIDPAISAFDLGNDPLEFAARQTALIDELLPHAGEAVVKPGESWAGARDVILGLLAYRTQTLINGAKLIGGLELQRSHRGDATLPLAPVAPELQRRALALVIGRGLGPTVANLLTPELLAILAPRRSRQPIELASVVPLEPPIHALVLAQHARVIDALFHPARLHRILDNTVRAAPGSKPLTLSELFDAVDTAVFAELGKPTDSYRRNLQRAVVVRWLALVREPDGATVAVGPVELATRPQPPPDARSLARAALRRIARNARGKLPPGDAGAHLAELVELIDKNLDAPPPVPATLAPATELTLPP